MSPFSATTSSAAARLLGRPRGAEGQSARPLADPLEMRPKTSRQAKLAAHTKYLQLSNYIVTEPRFASSTVKLDFNKFQSSDRHLFLNQGVKPNDHILISQTQGTQRSSGALSPNSPAQVTSAFGMPVFERPHTKQSRTLLKQEYTAASPRGSIRGSLYDPKNEIIFADQQNQKARVKTGQQRPRGAEAAGHSLWATVRNPNQLSN